MTKTPRESDTELGKVIRELRQRRGLSQGTLADRVGVDRKTINRIENGHHSTSIATFTAIAEGLGEKPSAILARID